MKRLFSILLVATLLMGMLALPAASVAETQYGVVKGGWLRLRSAASFNASTITSYYTGTVVTILSTSGDWYKVSTPDGRTGYMYSSYVDITGGGGGGGTGTARVWSSNGYGVRMRSGPGKGYRILAVYPVGTGVTILQRGSYWSQIQVGSRVGYMMNEFLVGGDIPTPVPSPDGNATIWSGNGYGVRLRTGPGTGYSIIGVYSVGTTVKVLEKGSIWSYIQVGTRTGYMMSEFLHFYSNTKVTNVTLNNTAPRVGDVLSVKTLTPDGATVSYSWKVGGIVKGTLSTYLVTEADANKKISLTVTGTGSYTDSATSAETAPVVLATAVTAVKLNNSTPVVGDVLKASSTLPADATISYRWMVDGIQVATSKTYTVQSSDENKIIELIVTGTGKFSGSASTKTQKVTKTADVTGVQIFREGKLLDSAPVPNDVLMAVVFPAGANYHVKYEWKIGTKTVGGNDYTFTVPKGYAGQTITVTVTGEGNYKKDATSIPTDPIVEQTRIQGVALSGVEVSAPMFRETGSTVLSATITPSGLESKVKYNWKSNGVSTGETGATYTVSTADIGKQITLEITGDGTNTTGSATTATASGIVRCEVSGIALTLSGNQVTATATPATATSNATLEWYRTGETTPFMTGSTPTYTVDATKDAGKTLTVKVIDGGNYLRKDDKVAASIDIPVVIPPVDAFTVTLTVQKDGSPYVGHGKTFTLQQSGQTVKTGTGSDGTVTFSGVANGTYDVYDGSEVKGSVTVNGSNATCTADYTTTPATTHTVTLTVLLDGNPYVGHGKTFTLQQSGQAVKTGTGSDGTVTFSDVADGTYDIYDGSEVKGSVTVSGNDATKTVTYTTAVTMVQVSFSLNVQGDASGSSISAKYDGAPITSGTEVPVGKTLVITVTPAGAGDNGTYTYAWAGRQDTSNELTTSNLQTAVNAVCTITGAKAPVTYKVTYNANGGAGSIADGRSDADGYIRIATGSNLTPPDNTMRFKQWNVQPDGSGLISYGADAVAQISGDLELFAIWETIPTPPPEGE